MESSEHMHQLTFLTCFHMPCVLVAPPAGTVASASLTPLAARLIYNNITLFETAVGPDGGVMFTGVDFNQPPQRYTLTLQLSPTTESALAADVSD
jgi:hypothetical protein